jgi:competence protein ComEA
MGQWLERYRGAILFTLVVLVIAAVVLLQRLRPEPAPIILTPPTASASPKPSSTLAPLRVYVSGAVNQPDVYELSPGSIIKDALLAAGGATEDADLNRINLALQVVEGQHIYVPHQGEENLPVAPPSEPFVVGGKVNLNTADLATLETLPGIGPTMAQRILDYRQAHGPFESIETVMEVSGIGPATFESIRDLITTK